MQTLGADANDSPESMLETAIAACLLINAQGPWIRRLDAEDNVYLQCTDSNCLSMYFRKLAHACAVMIETKWPK